MTSTHRNPVAVAFGRWLKAELVAQGIAPMEFAEQLGKPRASIHRWLRGATRPRDDQLPLIAEALGIELDLVLAAAGYRPYSVTVPGEVQRQVVDLVAMIPDDLLIPLLPMLRALAQPEAQSEIAESLRRWSAHHDR